MNKTTVVSPAEPDRLVELLNVLLADTFALYIKTKNFHWHMTGSHFREYHLLLDEQADQIFATTDVIAERVRKIGGTTIGSIGHIARLQTIEEDDSDAHAAQAMLASLCADNQLLIGELRCVHDTCNEVGDVATASLIETVIDDAERRTWFLAETISGSRDF